jgi:hypothetical protein
MHVPATRLGLTAALTGLQALDYYELDKLPIPPLYGSGVVYRREPIGREHWLSATEVLKVGHGDCEDLAAWRAAELQHDGEMAQAIAIKTGPRTFHAVVRREDGSIEDPSRILGMRVP